MCVYSMVIDQGRDRWPDPWRTHPPFRPEPPYVPPITLPLSDKERQELEELRAWKKLLEAAKAYDKVTGQPDCEDPGKVPFVDDILKRLDALEKAAKS